MSSPNLVQFGHAILEIYRYSVVWGPEKCSKRTLWFTNTQLLQWLSHFGKIWWAECIIWASWSKPRTTAGTISLKCQCSANCHLL